MREVRWSASALDDLLGAVEWIARDNPAAAHDIVDRIEAAGRSLGEMATGRRGRVPGIYEKPVAGLAYVIAYAIEKRRIGGERIMILRVIHAKRDWPENEWPP